MITINKINESFIKLSGYDTTQAQTIFDRFSYFVNGFQFMPKYKNGFWDGKINLFNRNTGIMNIGFLNSLKSLLKENGTQYQTSKKLRPIEFPLYTREFINSYMNDVIKWDYPLREDQINAIYNAIKYNKSITKAPTGSGKSLIIFMVIELLKNKFQNTKTLLLVPNTSLVEQMQSDFVDYGKNYKDMLEYTHIIYSGKDKYSDKPIIISTWQSMTNMPKDYFKQFDSIIVDEAHGINEKSKEVAEIVSSCTNTWFKHGTTATIGKGALNKMLLEGLLGKVNETVSTKKLMDSGILSKFEVNIMLLNHTAEDRQKCYNASYPNKAGKLVRTGMTYPDEMKFIRANEKRLKVINNIIDDIDNKDNVLILFRSIEYGKKIFNMLSENTTKKVFYVDGKTNVKTREEIRKYSETSSNIVIVASMQIFSTGINIKRLHNIVCAESVKSKLKTLQIIGRGLRLHETKDTARLYDIVDDLSWKNRNNFSMEHCLERIEIYEVEKFDYNPKEIDL